MGIDLTTPRSARIFLENSFYESILDLREKNPKAFAELSPQSKASLLFYEAARRQHEIDTQAVIEAVKRKAK